MDFIEAIWLAQWIKARSRDPEVLQLCDVVLSGLTKAMLTPANAVSTPPANNGPVSTEAANKPDRRAYMRELMRKRRAAARAGKVSG